MWPNSSLLKLLYLVLQKAMRVQILHPSSLLLLMGLIFLILLPILVNWIQISLYHMADVTIAPLSILLLQSQLLPNPTFSSNIHPDFILPLSSISAVRNYSSDHIYTLSALVKPLLEKLRNWPREREKCIYTDSEKRLHGIYGHPQTSSGNTLNASKYAFSRCKDG